MITSKQLKKGLLVWWTVTRYGSNNLDCPCVVTKVDKAGNVFRVRSFDDMNESEDLFIGRSEEEDESSLTEMRQINVEEIEDYIELRKGQFLGLITRAQVEVSKKQGELKRYEEKSLEALRQIRAIRF